MEKFNNFQNYFILLISQFWVYKLLLKKQQTAKYKKTTKKVTYEKMTKWFDLGDDLVLGDVQTPQHSKSIFIHNKKYLQVKSKCNLLTTFEYMVLSIVLTVILLLLLIFSIHSKPTNKKN